MADLNKESISNYYIAKIKPGKHCLIIPLGAKAKLNLENKIFEYLSTGTYTIKLTDISGVFWEHQIEKK